MSTKQKKENYTLMVSDSFEKTDEANSYEISFRRWLVREIEEQRMTIREAIEHFNFHPSNGIPNSCIFVSNKIFFISYLLLLC